MRIENELKLDFDNVLIRPKRSTLSSRSQVDLSRTFNFKNSKKMWTGVPIVVANMDSTGTFAMAVKCCEHKIITAIHKHYTLEEWVTFAAANANCLPYLAVSTGTSSTDLAKLKSIISSVPGIQFICIDVANGYSETFIDAVRATRVEFPEKTIIAGNVVTAELTEELILCGADIVKVGIGPGSVCTTRLQTGIGYPQLSAIIECADAAHGLGGHVCGDGGTKNSGDFCKAFGGGADFVMSGGMFAGHDESGGELITDPLTQKKVKAFYGMSSKVAMDKHSGGLADYRSSEGKYVTVPYRGSIDGTLLNILGGIRSCATYIGADCLKDIPKRTTFVRVSGQANEIFGSL